MKCVDRVRRMAASVGAELDEDCDFDIIVDAPQGYVWEANGSKALVSPAAFVGFEERTDFGGACNDTIDRMRYGLRIADDEERKAIEFDYDCDWSAPAGSPAKIEVRQPCPTSPA